jgi:hypothetical protein
MGHANPNSNELAAAILAKWRRYDRCMTCVYLAIFGFLTVALTYFWLATSAGERACKRWLATGEPRLKAISLRASTLRDRTEATCDGETIRYLEECFTNASPWTDGHATANLYGFPYSRQRTDVTVILHFDNGAKYQCPGPCALSADRLEIYLPGKDRADRDSPTTILSFDEPMPDGWKKVLMAILGPGALNRRKG